MRRIATYVLLGSLAISGLAIAQDAQSLVGQKVILFSGMNLRGEKTTPESDDRASATRFALDNKMVETYRVEKVDGDRVLIKIEKTGESGWVKRKNIVPVNDRMRPYTMAIKRDGSAINYNQRGLAWHVLGEQTKAIADFDQAIRLDPKVAEFHQNRGTARSSLGEWEKAIIDYNEAIRLNPKEALCHSWRGWAKLRRGDID